MSETKKYNDETNTTLLVKLRIYNFVSYTNTIIYNFATYKLKKSHEQQSVR